MRDGQSMLQHTRGAGPRVARNVPPGMQEVHQLDKLRASCLFDRSEVRSNWIESSSPLQDRQRHCINRGILKTRSSTRGHASVLTCQQPSNEGAVAQRFGSAISAGDSKNEASRHAGRLINTAAKINVFGCGFAVSGLGFKNFGLNCVQALEPPGFCWASGGLGAWAPGLQVQPGKGEPLPSWKRCKRAGYAESQVGQVIFGWMQ